MTEWEILTETTGTGDKTGGMGVVTSDVLVGV